MVTLNLQVAASADDAHERDSGSGFDAGNDEINANSNSDSGKRFNAGFRFQGVTIPQGATIDTAILHPYLIRLGRDSPDLDIRGEDVDDAADFSTTPDVTSRTRTTASVSWSANSLGVGFADSPELKTVLQEIVNRSGYASGSDIVILCDGKTSPNAKLEMRAYDHTPSQAAKLDITYTATASPAVITITVLPGTVTQGGTTTYPVPDIRQVYVAPYRPAIDATLMPTSGQALAGCLPKILVGSWRGDTIIWDDVWTLDAARVEQLVIGRTTSAESLGQQTMYAICGDGIHYWPIGTEAHPARQAWPATHGQTSAQPCSGWNFEAVATVQRIVVSGEFLQADDRLDVYTRWDNEDRWEHLGPFTPFPVVTGAVPGSGRTLWVVAAITDDARSAAAPRITKVEIPAGFWETNEEEPGPLGSDFASPQSF